MFTTTKTTKGFDKDVTEDLNQETAEGFTTNETTELFVHINNIIEATEGLRIKLQDLDITKGANLAVNMVEVTQETAMEVGEQRLGKEEYVKVAYPKQDESLV